MYGRGDVEVMTDQEFQERIAKLVDQNELFSKRSNLILIGDEYQNSVTKHVLGQSASEGIRNNW